MTKPLKRVKALKELSRDHHYGLLLSWKISKGLRLNIAPERIKRYTNWFWENHLQAHFEFEEKFIFPIMEKENKLIKRALKEHRRLKRLFTVTDKLEHNLSFIEEELVAHIRFEERILFQEIQTLASEEQLKMIEQIHSKNILKKYIDEFWL
jgi:iron-sulfur cluster repair protein YtfE (RIC family)